MATRGRESTPGKEKRGTSSSHQLHGNTTQQNRHLSLSRPSDPPDSPASEKHIPNYLKPTSSSSPDVSKQLVKKQVSSDASKKQNLMRTRSLDKAGSSSPSRTPKTCTSPNPAQRSSSFSAKTTIAQKSIPDKLLKSPKDGGKHRLVYARSESSLKKISTIGKKQDAGSGASTKKEEAIGSSERVVTPDISEVSQVETLQEEEFSVMEVEEENIHARSNNEMGYEVLVLEDMESVRQVQLESRKDDELVEYSTVSEHQDASYVEMKETDKHIADEENKTKTNGSVTGIPKVEAKEKEGEGENALDEKEKAIIVGETFDSEGTKDQEVEKEVKHEAENAAPQQQSAQGKKNSAVSNDVIEETASKLREQRRNKVRALAGAFETVISLQEPK
ncbi:ABC transporter F family member 4 [Olea europaea subsp. europaea]|uniref:ABC transporter F family member 4 n=1 Tax=Olea europaea subsp. europaea TaxID=158383 RepID=A0A8S0PPM8_OLEEU|nr:ABC transporter F family member 4 [Olea europaea subsp. europaea]